MDNQVPRDLCRIEIGGTPPRSTSNFWDETKSTTNVWLSIADMPKSLHARISTSAEHLSDEGAKRVKIVKAGTPLVSFKLTLGRLAYADTDLRTNEAIAALALIHDSLLSKEYLYWYLTFFDWQKAAEGEDKIKGKTLNKAKLAVLPVLVPPFLEQKRIVAILDEAFEAMATIAANVETNLKNARELFDSYRDAVFATMGEGWDESKLDQLIEIKHGFAFKSEYFTSEGRYVLLTPGNVFEEGGYRDRGEKQKYYIGEIPHGFILKKGDFLIAMTEQAAGLLGSPVIVPDDDRFLHNQRLGLVQVKPGAQWSNQFFFHAFNTKDFRNAAHDSGTGVKVRHTSPKKLGEIEVRYAGLLDEQDKVARRLDDLLDRTQRLEEKYRLKLSQIDELKRSILQKAFSGELTALPSRAVNEAAE
jgi:type I restriction enzyme, S subunit